MDKDRDRQTQTRVIIMLFNLKNSSFFDLVPSSSYSFLGHLFLDSFFLIFLKDAFLNVVFFDFSICDLELRTS